MITPELLKEMRSQLPPEDADEMAIPSYLHPFAPMRWMAWRRVRVVERGIDRAGIQMNSPKPERRALDFGCGTGVLFEALLAQFGTIYGVDLVLQPARLLVERVALSNVSLLEPDALDATIEDDSLDMIVCAEVLEHIEDLPSTIDLLRRKLSSSGVLIATLPTENTLYRLGRKLAGFSGHYHLENADSIHRRMVENGLRCRWKSSIPLPGPFAIYHYGEYLRSDLDK